MQSENMNIINKLLNFDDFKNVAFQSILKELEIFHRKKLKKGIHTIRLKLPVPTRIHWSRDWEYPWAILSSNVKAGERVLDCGCGGSPFLPFLAYNGCIAYGIDPNIYNQISLTKYYLELFKFYIESIKYIIKWIKISVFKASRNTSSLNNINLNPKQIDFITRDPKSENLKVRKSRTKLKPILNLLRTHMKKVINPVHFKRPTGLGFLYLKPIKKMGLNIQYSSDSIAKMHFKDNFFDKVFCISVIEHLPEEIMIEGIKEMARVLRKDGLLTITFDYDGKSSIEGICKKFIKTSGLELYGLRDFSIPKREKRGPYNIAAFFLKK